MQEQKLYKIKIKVVEIRGNGKCAAGLKVGDEFEIDKNGQPVPINFCAWAFVSLWPFITPLRYGGTLPWEKDPDKAFVACPDPETTVIFQIIREEDNENYKELPAF